MAKKTNLTKSSKKTQREKERQRLKRSQKVDLGPENNHDAVDFNGYSDATKGAKENQSLASSSVTQRQVLALVVKAKGNQ